MIDERSLGVKVPVESTDSALVEGPKERDGEVTWWNTPLITILLMLWK